MPWLAEGAGSIAERLARAVAEDIRAGRLSPGSRLPPHREVAHALGISVGTATKAYATVERWGLGRGTKGRGTFVELPPDAQGPDAPIDLSQNLPPPVLTDAALADALARLARRVGGLGFGGYPPPAGRPALREALAGWLAGHRLRISVDRVVATNGAQHALSVAFALLCRPGSTILTEAATYPGIRAIAAHAGYRLQGVALDAEGVVPDALEKALRAAAEPRVLHLVPTRQNPTAVTMGPGRRRDVAALVRRHGAWIVEDDVYSVLSDAGEPTLAELVPERTLYVNSLSKALSPGLRVGFLACPESLVGDAVRGVLATTLTANPLTSLLASAWLSDGTAATLGAAIRAEATRRTALAIAAFPGLIPEGQGPSHHVWLPMAAPEAERFARRALSAGVLVTPPEAPVVDPALASGVRICLGAAVSVEALGRALEVLRGVLAAGGSGEAVV
ncbi:aminotransferase-like domain-containing protein [Arenibaculum pallidiluteum]|uniref:aminotransferase-like domain-containing protein n=1 Tax=Arenibaculum pallidiluteum TaxID=2812559 RepID=UPI001A962AB1|nr:PLP-dependent aminotransferase family protein [Arenibaculum pallidiluteum]